MLIHSIQFCTHVHFSSHSFPWCWRLLKERLTATGRTTTMIRRGPVQRRVLEPAWRGAALSWPESICWWFRRTSSCSKVDKTYSYMASCIRIYQHHILPARGLQWHRDSCQCRFYLQDSVTSPGCAALPAVFKGAVGLTLGDRCRVHRTARRTITNMKVSEWQDMFGVINLLPTAASLRLSNLQHVHRCHRCPSWSER